MFHGQASTRPLLTCCFDLILDPRGRHPYPDRDKGISKLHSHTIHFKKASWQI